MSQCLGRSGDAIGARCNADVVTLCSTEVNDEVFALIRSRDKGISPFTD